MNRATRNIGSRVIGYGQPVYVIAEIGLNHNGSIETALDLVRMAADAGCQAVKFQKRTPELCTPKDQWHVKRETPWGYIDYIDYRHKVELDRDAYVRIDQLCRDLGIDWFSSCWDEESVDFMEDFEPIAYKVASASLTDAPLLKRLAATGRPILLSTGMSTMDQIREAVSLIPMEQLSLAHATSAYPCSPDELNLQMIKTLDQTWDVPVGYSGHEVGLQTSVAAVALGARFIERHVTLDRAMWGSDHSASLESAGLERLVRDIRVVERALGDGDKVVYDSERPVMAKLRRTP